MRKIFQFFSFLLLTFWGALGAIARPPLLEMAAVAAVQEEETVDPVSVSPENMAKYVLDEEGGFGILVTFNEEVKVDPESEIHLKCKVLGLDLVAEVANYGEDRTQFVLSFPDVEQAGNYILVCPAGAFRTVKGDVNSTAFTNYYTLVKPFAYTSVSPANGSTVSGLHTITFGYADAVNIPPVAQSTQSGVKVVGPEGEEYLASLQYNGETAVQLVVSEKLTAPGTYTITVPEQYVWNSQVDFNADEVTYTELAACNSAFTLTYTVKPVAPSAVTPENMTEYVMEEDGFGVVLTFPEEVQYTGNAPVLYGKTSREPLPMEVLSNGEDAKQMTLVYGDAIQPGSYALDIPAGAFQTVDGGFDCAAATYNYMLKNPADSFAYTSVTPADGSTVSGLKTIKLSYPENVTLPPVVGTSMGVKAVDADGHEVMAAMDYDAAGGVQIVLSEAITTAGKYTITVPEQYIWNDQVDFDTEYVGDFAVYNSEFTLTYTVKPVEPVAVVPENMARVSMDEEGFFGVVLTFPEDVNYDEANPVVLRKGKGTPVPAVVRNMGDDRTQMTLLFDGVTEVGNYVLDAPAGAFRTANGEFPCAGFNYYYTIAKSADSFAYAQAAPASATSVKELSTIKLTFPEEVGFVMPFARTGAVKVLNAKGEEVCGADVDTMDDDWNAVLIQLAEPLTEAGTYTITVPAQSVWDQRFDDEAEDFGVEKNLATHNPEFTLMYHVVPSSKNPSMDYPTLSPNLENPEVVYETLPGVDMTFKGVVKYNEENDIVVVKKGTSDFLKAAVSFGPAAAEGATAHLTFEPAITEAGEYQLIVPANTFMDANALLNDYRVYDFVIKAAPNSFVPANRPVSEDVVAGLKDVKVTFAEKVGYVTPEGLDGTALTVLDANGQPLENVNAKIKFDAYDLNAIHVVVDPAIYVAGNYTIKIAEGTVWNARYDEAAADKGVANGAVYNSELALNYTLNILAPVSAYPANMSSVDLDEEGSFGVVLTFAEEVYYNEKNPVQLSNRDFTSHTPYVLNNGEDRTQMTLVFDGLAKAGNYVLNVPAGAFRTVNGDLDCDAFTYYYKLYKPADSFAYTKASPASGSTVSGLSTVKLTFPETVTIAPVAETTQGVKVVDAEGNEYLTALQYDEADFAAVDIVLAEHISKAGTYSITVPEGYLWDSNCDLDQDDLGAEKNFATHNPEFTLTYTVNPVQPVAAKPESMSAVVLDEEGGFGVVLTFPEEVEYNEEHPVLLSKRNFTSATATVVNNGEDRTTMTLVFPDVTEVGNYVLNVPAGAFRTVNGGYDCADFVYYYTLLQPADSFAYTEASPASGSTVSGLSTIKLTFPENVTIAPVAETNLGVKAVDAEGNEYMAALAYDDNDWSAVNVVLSETLSAAGTYTITIPEQYIWNDKADFDAEDYGVSNFAVHNPEFTLTYTVEPVVPVAAEPESMSGVVLDEEGGFGILLTFPEEVVCMDESLVVLSKRDFTSHTPYVVSNGEDRTMMTLVFPDVTETGSYVLNVPAGAFRTVNGGYDCGAFLYYYNLLEPTDSFTYTEASPASGSTVKSLKTVKLTFPENVTIAPVAETSLGVKAVDAEGNEYMAVLAYDENDWSAVDVVLSEELTAAGTYTITIPEQYIWNDKADFDAEDFGVSNFATHNPEFTLTYTVEPVVPVAAVPADMESVMLNEEGMFAVQLTFPEEVICTDERLVVLSNRGFASFTPNVLNNGEDFTKLTLVFDGVTEAGNYILNVPAGAFRTLDGDFACAGFTYHYMMRKPADSFVYAEADPADGSTVEELYTIKLTFPEGVGCIMPFATGAVKVLNAEGEEVCGADVDTMDDDWNAVLIHLGEPLTEAGTYTITVPAKSIWNMYFNEEEEDFGVENYGATFNPEFTLTYTVAENYNGGVSVNENGEEEEEYTVSFEDAEEVEVTDNLFGVVLDKDGFIAAVAYTTHEENMGAFVTDEAKVCVTFNRVEALTAEQLDYAYSMATEMNLNGEAGKTTVCFRPNSFTVNGVAYDKEISKSFAVTGIEAVKTETEYNVFDLQGRHVANPVKGNLYIKNGEKMLK